MATEYKWEAPAALQSYLTTELNSLADDDSVVGAKIDNVADGENEMFIALELVIAEQGGARDGGGVDVYLIPSLDDTNFGYGDAAGLVDPGNLLCTFDLDAAVTARRVIRANLPIPPLDFKLQPFNRTGQAFAATGNTLSYRLYSPELQTA